jgi:NRPS condensation-like uncharacterized protein
MPAPRPRRFAASAQDWFSVAIAIGHDRTIRLVLELGGMIDHERLARALRLLIDAEPILGCRFVASPLRAHWRERDDLDSLELCGLVPTADASRDLHAFMAESIDPERDPLVQIRVFRADADTVCFKVSHAAMDGGGFKQLVHRLIAAYRGLAADASLVLPPGPAPDRGQGQVLRLYPLRRRIGAFLTQPFHKKEWSFPFTDGEPREFTFATMNPEVRVTALREAARRRGGTIMEALVAGFARALLESTDAASGVPIPFVLPVDLRRHLPDPNAAGLCNLSSLAWFELERKPGAPVEETVADVHQGLERALKDMPGIGLAVVMELAALPGYGLFHFFNNVRARMARRQGSEFPSLSNIGPMDPVALDFGDAHVRQARFYAPVFFPPTFCVVVGSFGDKLYFTVSYPASVVPAGLMERYLDRLEHEIRAML